MRPGSVDYYLVTGAVVFIVISIVLGVLVFDTEEDKDTTIRVDEVYFVMKRQTGTTSIIEITVFVSNVGEVDIDDLLIRAFSVEAKSNLAKDDSVVHVLGVAKGTTAEGRLMIEVPNRDQYRIELLVFRDGRLDLRGAGTIDLTSIGTATDYRTYPDGGGGSGIPSAMEDGTAAFSVCSLMIASIVAVAVVIFLIIVFRPKKGTVPEGIVPMHPHLVEVREGASDAMPEGDEDRRGEWERRQEETMTE